MPKTAHIDCSIIICTRNRARMLERTLRAFQNVRIPPDWQVEMIVADNGSVDETAEVVAAARHTAIRIRRLHEPYPGKSRAQNAAMAVAAGEALLFTDDDVEPAVNWVESMARPLLEKRCEAVTGRILLADDLRRPWFTRMHEMWLAEVPEPAGHSPELIGACMGIHRSVFDVIDNFDENLGPGVTGFGEETLVWLQMIEAGMRIHPVIDTFVIHHPEPSRLLRSNWLATATQRGHTKAYVMHHWAHARIHCPAQMAFLLQVKLFLRRLWQRPVEPDAEGCAAWEMSYLTRIEGFKRMIHESQRPRNYEYRALRRRTS